MNKSRFLGILVIVMIALNFTILSFFFFGRSGHGPRHRPVEIKKVISERLGFSEAQNEAYQSFIVEHRKAIRTLDEKMMSARTVLYSQLSKNEAASVDSQLLVIGRLQTEIETIHYNHFAEIKKLCNEDQLPAFNELTIDLAEYFGASKRPKREH